MPPSIPRFRACAARGCSRSSACGARLKVCARCKTSYYCSTECQTADWPNHKQICNTNSSVDSVFRSLPNGLSESTGLSIDLRRWESLHTPTFVTTCISAMRLCENPENVFNQALVCHVIPRDSNEPQAKFAIASAEVKSFNAVSEFLRNAGYDEVMDRHELENQTARADGALGYALVLLHCEAPQLSRLLQVKPVLISYEAIEAYGRSPVPTRPREDLTQALGRAIDEDWARLYHMSVIAAAHFMEPNSIVRARA